jgi:hypothetical protein
MPIDETDAGIITVVRKMTAAIDLAVSAVITRHREEGLKMTDEEVAAFKKDLKERLQRPLLQGALDAYAEDRYPKKESGSMKAVKP